jgi:hypothetical protein
MTKEDMDDKRFICISCMPWYSTSSLNIICKHRSASQIRDTSTPHTEHVYITSRTYQTLWSGWWYSTFLTILHATGYRRYRVHSTEALENEEGTQKKKKKPGKVPLRGLHQGAAPTARPSS